MKFGDLKVIFEVVATILWALQIKICTLYRAIELIFNSRDLEMAAENVNLVTRPFNLKRTGLYIRLYISKIEFFHALKTMIQLVVS